MRKGVLDSSGLLFAVGFGLFLALVGALTQNYWGSALIGAVTYYALLVRDGVFQLKL